MRPFLSSIQSRSFGMASTSPPSSTSTSSRTLVLCFDGTDEEFQTDNTNVVKLFNVLMKDSPEQLVYYQPGIGTYAAPGVMGSVQKWFAMLIDEAFAWYLDIHIMGGYDFLMQNYREGDRICLFGFSRGAYTARALAGMIYKVGLVPIGNVEQVGFAYNLYKSTSKKNVELAAQFKETFSKSVIIDFVGCWETVASVGLFFSRNFPFTTGNTAIKYFRHAVALDEHRARFKPNLYHRPSPDVKAALEDPQHDSFPISLSGPASGWTTDVLEVWFSGCHTDVGGGEVPQSTPSLSDITLHWMIREIVGSQCGVNFDAKALAAANIPLSMINLPAAEAQLDKKLLRAEADAAGGLPSPLYSPQAAKLDSVDSIQPLHDPLKSQPLWWVLEVIPFFVSWQDQNGIWHRSWRWNLGRPRQIPDPTPNLHITVQERIQDATLAYTPRAVWKNKPKAVFRY